MAVDHVELDRNQPLGPTYNGVNVKVLIYSSKELYEKSSYAGRAEAHVIAYRDGLMYVVLKNRTTQYMSDQIAHYAMARTLQWAERDMFNLELAVARDAARKVTTENSC